MAGRVFKRGGTYHIGFSFQGVEYRKSALTRSKRQAQETLNFYFGQCARGEFRGFVLDTPYTVNDMLDDLIKDCGRRNLRDVDGVIRRTTPFCVLGALPARHLSERAIERYVDQREKAKVAPATIQKELRYIKQAMRIAHRKHYIEQVLHLPRIKVDNARQGFFEHDEFERIVAVLPSYLKDVAQFGYYSGWRKREVTTLEWRDVQGEVIRLRPEVSKTAEGRVLAIVGVIAEIIERRQALRNGPRVFHRDGAPLKDFRTAWRRACQDAGVARYFHDFRRTAVRNMTRAGVPEKIAMSITGHKAREVFDRYNIVNVSDIKAGLMRTFTHLTHTARTEENT